MFRYIRNRWLKIKKEYKYNIPVDSEKTIEYVEFSYCKNKKGKTVIWLLVDGEPTGFRDLHSCTCIWELNKKVAELKLVSTKKLKRKYMKITVVYDGEAWIKLEPGDSYPLPTEPTEVNRVTFEAKTDSGTSSTLTLFFEEYPIMEGRVHDTPETFIWNIVAQLPAKDLSLTNTGTNTVYIRNLTTE